MSDITYRVSEQTLRAISDYPWEHMSISRDDILDLSGYASAGDCAATSALDWLWDHKQRWSFYEYNNYEELVYVTACKSEYLLNSNNTSQCWQFYSPPVEAKQQYTGWKILTANDDRLAQFYSNPTDNILDCLSGEYAVLLDESGKPLDLSRWDGCAYKKVKTKYFNSMRLGELRPKDIYQRCAFDSLMNDDMTLLYGSSGTGKTCLPLAYIMQEIEADRLKCCNFVFHYEKLKNSRGLGYVKGTLRDKQMQSGSLGNILSSKLGGTDMLSQLLDSGKFRIIATSDIRGFECGADEAIFCTEAQDLDAYTTRTIIQRAKEGCKIILEGDVNEQVDIPRKSGLGQVIDVFKGEERFGCVKLVNDYRSPFGRLADKIRD